MQKRRIITVFFISVTAVLALITAIADIFEKSDMVCATTSCVKVHSSSFATVFSLPVGIYAAFFLALALCLYLAGKNRLTALILWALLGAESYYTFIQFVFIESLCITCLTFFSLLIACIIASGRVQRQSSIIMGVTMFLAAHFVFFFPSVTLKPTLIQNLSDRSADIEIFASPSCSHCEEAIKHLSEVCTETGTQLVVRPVCISAKDREKSVQWVSGELFKCDSPTSYRLAEKIVWENEAEAREIANGELQVPLILVRTGGFKEVFTGWDRKVQDKIFRLFAKAETKTKTGVGIVEASLLTHLNQSQDKGAICSRTSGCHE
jgi:uncharacterized membrane protein